MKKLIEFLKKILPNFLFKKEEQHIYTPVDNFKRWSTIEQDILFEINKHRKNNFLLPFNSNKDCWEEAKKRCDYFDGINWITHKNVFDSFEDLKQLGLKSPAEIIEVNHPTAKGVVDAWMASPGHNLFILSKLHTEIGIKQFVDLTTDNNITQTYVCALLGR